MKPDLRLGLAAAAFLLAGAGGAALAHPHPDGDGGKVEKFVIVNGGGEHHAKGQGKGERIRRVEIIRDGKGGEHHAGSDRVRRVEMHGIGRLADCEGGEKIVDEQAGDGGKKTKIVICRMGAPTAADAKHLEDALARIGDNDHLSDEQKARIETALRSAIDRARSAR